MRKKRMSWDCYFMSIAILVSKRSSCLSVHKGAILVRGNQLFASGYNGTPKGLKNCDEGGCPRCASNVPSGTDLDKCLCSHAEENAIVQSAFLGIHTKGSIMYCTFSPCIGCAKMIINAGITEIVFKEEYKGFQEVFRLLKAGKIKCRKFHP